MTHNCYVCGSFCETLNGDDGATYYCPECDRHFARSPETYV